MTLKNQLDEVDLKILDIITKNARIPFKDVAEEVGISRAAVHQRVNRMIDMKVIIGSGRHHTTNNGSELPSRKTS